MPTFKKNFAKSTPLLLVITRYFTIDSGSCDRIKLNTWIWASIDPAQQLGRPIIDLL